MIRNDWAKGHLWFFTIVTLRFFEHHNFTRFDFSSSFSIVVLIFWRKVPADADWELITWDQNSWIKMRVYWEVVATGFCVKKFQKCKQRKSEILILTEKWKEFENSLSIYNLVIAKRSFRNDKWKQIITLTWRQKCK